MILTPEEVAQRWQVNDRTIYRLLTAGKLTGFRVGKLWRIPEEAIIKYEKGE